MQDYLAHLIANSAMVVMPLIILTWIGIMIWVNVRGEASGGTLGERLKNRLLANVGVGCFTFLGLAFVFGLIVVVIGFLVNIFR